MTAPQPPERTAGRRRLLTWLGLGMVLLGLAVGAAYWLTRLLSSERGAGAGRSVDEPPVQRGEERSDSADGPPWFRDVTSASGVDFTYRNGEEADQYTILESLGGGAALIDYDGDGLLDLFVTGGGQFVGADRTRIEGLPCKLYKNRGGWKFQDVTRAAGLDVAWWYTHGVAVADYDRDGWPDLLVTGYGRLALFHNESDGKGRRFVDVTQAVGLRDDAWSTGAGWADLDGDGFPELYVCHYTDWSFSNHPVCVGQLPGVARDICPPHRFKPQKHALYRNDKGRGFGPVSAAEGFQVEGYGLGVVLVDLNGDGRPDVYVANDMSNNLLLINRGGRLEEKGLPAGVALDEEGRATASMGVDAGDYDGSGRPSLFVTNFQREVHSLFRNLGRELFYYQSRPAGLAALERTNVGWGTGFVDVDNDGWEDLVIANGHVFRHPAGAPHKQRPLLLHNVPQDEQRAFRDVSASGGVFFRTPRMGRGLAIGDLDNDGWPDLVVSHSNSPLVLLRNEAVSKARWLGVKLVGRDRRDVVGSTVVLEGATRNYTRFARGGGGYLSARDPRLLFGLGAAEQARRVTVHWSWGETQSWDHLEPGHYYELHEGQPMARKLAGS